MSSDCGRPIGTGINAVEVERTMKYMIHEDPITHKFMLLRLPDKFRDGDKFPILPTPTDQWFDTREEAVAALPELLNLEE